MTGESLRVARIQLLQVGLQLGEVTSYSTPSITFDGVLQQDPPSGAKATSPRVDLLVAEPAPPAAFVMPWLVGMPLADAERLLSTGGIKFSKTTIIPSPQWPKGDVIEQRPEPGSKIMGDTAIEVVVAQ